MRTALQCELDEMVWGTGDFFLSSRRRDSDWARPFRSNTHRTQIRVRAGKWPRKYDFLLTIKLVRQSTKHLILHEILHH